jgi:hypothetical protein
MTKSKSRFDLGTPAVYEPIVGNRVGACPQCSRTAWFVNNDGDLTCMLCGKVRYITTAGGVRKRGK